MLKKLNKYRPPLSKDLRPRPYGRERLYRTGFLLSLLAVLVGLCISFGGLLAMQLFCNSNGELIDGVKEEYQSGLELEHGLGGFECSRWLRFEWWAWCLNCVFLTLLFLCWWFRRIRQYYVALFFQAAVTTTLNMMFADYLLTEYYRTEGTLQTRGIIAFLGTNLMTGAYFLLAWFGCALYFERMCDTYVCPLIPGQPTVPVGNGNSHAVPVATP